MTPSEKSKREKLAATPGLTRAQAAAIRDPEYSLRLVGILLAALREQAAAVHAAKPEAQRDLERKMGLTHLVNTDSVQFDGVRQSFGGRTIEVPRG